MLRKILSLTLSLSLLLQYSGFAQTINLADYLSHTPNTVALDRFRPLALRYFSYEPAVANFKILLDKGDQKDLSDIKIKDEADKLLTYFKIGLSLPNEKFWVNLRPDAADQIIDPELEKTDLGKVLLEADLQLKKDTSSLTSPQSKEGKIYWEKLYKKAGELFGTENITIPTITRPWIVPGEIIVRESQDSAYIYKAVLKVMLEEDYLNQRTEEQKNKRTEGFSFSDPRLKELNKYSTELIKESILPELTRRINSSKDYASLRQVFFSLILARWFKDAFGGSGSARVSAHPSTTLGASQSSENSYIKLIDSQDLTNLTSKDPWSKTTYFNEYKRSFNEGEYNLSEKIPTPGGQVIRRYTSGGMLDLMNGKRDSYNPPDIANSSIAANRNMVEMDVAGNLKVGSPLVEDKELVEEFNKFDQRLKDGDEKVLDEIVNFYKGITNDNVKKWEFYKWLQNHQSAMAANAMPRIGLCWEGIVPELTAIVKGESDYGNPYAAARQLHELNFQETIGGLKAPREVVEEAKNVWRKHGQEFMGYVYPMYAFLNAKFPIVGEGKRPGKLVIVRHGETSWSEAVFNKWAGWLNSLITGKGRDEARKAGEQFKEFHFDLAYSSDLSRAKDTGSEFLAGSQQEDLVIEEIPDFREKSYGALAGWSRADVQKAFGDDLYNQWRRAPKGRAPLGENLEDTKERVGKYLLEKILPAIAAGKNVVISAHGNSLRSLLVILKEHTSARVLSDKEIEKLEVKLSVPIAISFDNELNHKEMWSDQHSPKEMLEFLQSGSPLTPEDVGHILSQINIDTDEKELLAILSELEKADMAVLKQIDSSIYNQVMEATDGGAESNLSAEDEEILRKRYQFLNKAIEQKTRYSYASWKELEEKEFFGKGISQSSRNLSRPLRVAFNIDTFAADSNVALYSGSNRIFDAIFRLLEGNPNFAPEAVFLGDYAKGMPSSMERLAEFLNSNPLHGNAKYSVKLKVEGFTPKLIINGKEIKLYYGFASPRSLKDLDIDFLIDAGRQNHINIESRAAIIKGEEERVQLGRIESYLEADPDLKVVVIAPEEDKDFKGEASLVNRVNTAQAINPDTRKFIMAEPVTTVSGIMAKVVSDALKSRSEKVRVSVVKVEAIRTDREGNRTMNMADAVRPGLKLNEILGNPESGFAVQVSNNGALSGANIVRLILRVDGFLKDFSPEALNEAFRTASKGVFKGMIEVKGEPTVSSFNTFNQHALVYLPIKNDDIKTVNPPDGPSYKTAVLSGYYSETGYAKEILDLMTGVSMFKGNKAVKNDFTREEFPSDAIPATPELIRPQKIPDGEAIPVALNGGSGGRIAVNAFLRLWDDPNFEVVLINGVRGKVEDLVATFFEYDAVFGQAPFEVELIPNKKAFKFTDRQERVVLVSDSTRLSLAGGDIIHTPYGNLLVEQKNGLITMRLHGEDVERQSVKDNQDNTYTMQGSLKNGTIVRLTYRRGDSEDTVKLISAGVRKQRIVKIANIRADENIYAYDKKKEKDGAAFLNKVREYNKKLARRILAELPDLNQNTIFLDCSGAMLEEIKFEPFYMAGSGRGVISAPSKAAKDPIPGTRLVDATVIPGVNSDAFISTWDILQTGSCASCTSNAAALGAKALMDILFIASGYFDTLHAITRTQGGQFGNILKNITRSVEGYGNIVPETTGASTELGKAIPELLNIISGVSFRNGTIDGSLVTFDFQVSPGAEGNIPSAQEINAKVKWLSETPEIEGGLKGFLGYGSHKTSLEIIGSEFGGIFDPSRTKVNKDSRTVSVSLWYDNERGYTNQYVMLTLLSGLHQRELEKKVYVIAQDVMVSSGPYTGGLSMENVVKDADGAVIGSRQCRIFEERANLNRKTPVNINELMNQKIKKALAAGMELPILNIYISQDALKRGEAAVSVNKQIAESLKDIPAEDMIRIMVSLEAAEAEDFGMDKYESLAKDIRKAVAGLAAKIFLDQARNEIEEIEKSFGAEGYKKYISGLKAASGGEKDEDILANYSRLLGANVASKVRVILKVGKEWLWSGILYDWKDDMIQLVNREGIDGIILPPSHFETARKIVEGINQAIENNPVKKQELSRRFSPRFFLSLNGGSDFMDKNGLDALLGSGVNSHIIQLAAMPNLADIGDVSAALRGEDLPPNRATLPDKVPVRIMLQDGTPESNKEGFVNLEGAVKRLGVHDILIAHSEVLERTGMSDEEVAELVKQAQKLKNDGILRGSVIGAVGENLADYSLGRSKEIVSAQVRKRLGGLTAKEAADIIIAYEPRWAIGSGKTPTEQDIQGMHLTIRNTIKELYGVEAFKKVRIIYGGSLNLENAEWILRLKDVDGALIGGASTDPAVFKKIVELARKISGEKNEYRASPRRMYISGNHKAYEIKAPYDVFVKMVEEGDDGSVEVSIGPELNNIARLAEVYTKDPLKDIVALNQLSPNEYKGKIFYVRFAGNVPINDAKAQPNNPDTWEITDDTRLLAVKETVDLIRKNGGIVVLHTHFEPKGNNLKGPQSIRFLVPHLKKILGVDDISFVSEISGSGKQNALRAARPGDVILLENLRLDKEIAQMEKAEGNTPAAVTARNKLASLLYTGTNSANPKANVVYVNESFDSAHRDNASISAETPGIPRLAGLSFVKELTYGIKAIREARHPVAIVFGGGPKIGDKIPMLKNIIRKTLTHGDKLFVYGGAAVPFLMAKDSGFEPGLSRGLVNQENLGQAQEIIRIAQQEGVEIILPVDFVVADSLPSDESQRVFTQTVGVDNIPTSKGAYDIGEKTIAQFKEEALDREGKSRFGVIIGNGPAGVYEFEQFRDGSRRIYEIIAQATRNEQNPDGAQTILGGGDTATVARITGLYNRFSFISTGGGAFLNLLEGKDVPGVAALRGKAGMYSYHLRPDIERGYKNIREVLSDYAAGINGASSALGEKNVFSMGKFVVIGSLSDEKLSGFVKRLEEANIALSERHPELNVTTPLNLVWVEYGSMADKEITRADTIITDPETANKIGENFIPILSSGDTVILQRKKGVSSAIALTEKPEIVGGIDLTQMNMLIQPQGGFASSSLDFSLPELSRVEIEAFDLDKELEFIQRMASSGIDPIDERLKKYLAVCFARGRTGKEIDELKLCLEDVFIAQQLDARQTPDGYKEVIVIADTRRYVLKESRLAAGYGERINLN